MIVYMLLDFSLFFLYKFLEFRILEKVMLLLF